MSLLHSYFPKSLQNILHLSGSGASLSVAGEGRFSKEALARAGRSMLIASFALFLASCSATQSSENQTPQNQKGQARVFAPGFEKWVEGNSITISATNPDATSASMGGNHTWRYEILGPGDARVVESRSGGDASSVLLVGGKILAAKNIPLKPGAESDAIDGPAIMVNLLFEILARSLPEGPSAVQDQAVINLSEQSRALIIATDTAYTVFPAPWSARGVVRRQGEKSLAYDLQLAYTGAGKQGGKDFELRSIRGEWKVDPALRPIDSKMRLSGYHVYLLSPRTPEGRVPAERLDNMSSLEQVLTLLSARENAAERFSR